MKRNFSSLGVLVILTLVYGCEPTGPQYVDEYDITYTNYDNTCDFAARGTYSLPDKIVKITGIDNQPPKYVKDVYGVPILQQIDANMQKLGWTKVDINNNPDLQLLPAAWESTTVIYGGWWNYYCWYYPYYCGGGWYYPFTPVANYTTGTLVMLLVDPNQQSTDDNNRVVWVGAINGLLTGSYDASRLNKGIDQAFTQSAYLKTN